MSEQTQTQTETKTVEQTQSAEQQTQQPATENLLTTKTENAEQTTQNTETAETERPTWLPEKFKTAEDLAKSYTELEKTLAEKSAKVPTEYDFSYAKEFGLADMDNELKAEVTQAFQHAKLTEQQAKEVMAIYSDQVSKLTEQLQNAPRTNLTEEQSVLQKNWGDDYAKNIQAVKQYAETLPKRMLEHPLVDTAEGIEFLQKLMNNNVQNPIVSATTTRPSVISIREQINTMRDDGKMKLPAGDPVGEAHRQKLYNLYEQLERAQQN